MRREQEIKEQNIKKMKEAFEIRKKVVEKENLEKSKKYFEKYIANIFLKEFMIETGKKIEFKVSLISRIQNLTQEFMNNCQKFINSFKSNTSKIINEFDIKEIEPIEHINFIVVGKAGVGKSTFINEALLLSEDKRAEEGDGESVTRISSLYTSEKLKMVRMWDTPGLDDKISKDHILKEIQRLIEDGSQQGPDHYINIILYCTSGLDQRFQKEDEELIKAIMKIYPFDNLPVIITQLKSYMPLMAENMEKVIRNVLKKYDEKIVEKIEIKSIISRDCLDRGSHIKAHGIPELLRLSFDIMGRSIASATCKKISEEIENLCKNFMNKKKLFIKNIFKYEMELLEVAKNYFIDNLEEENNELFVERNELSELNIYKNIDNPTYFIDNFCKTIKDKFLDIFNYLENENLQLNDIENENIEQENNVEENQAQENNVEENQAQENNVEENQIQEINNNNEQNNINENINQQNNENEVEEQENDDNEEEENEEQENNEQNDPNENNHNEDNQNENNQVVEEIREKSPVELLVQENLKKLGRSIDEASNKTFDKIFKKRYDDYLKDLLKEQEAKNREFQNDESIINILEVENSFKEKLLPIFKNEFYKIFFCIILKLFMNNLEQNFESIIKKELIDNEEAQKILHQKAENSLKIITENLKEKLISELDIVMKEKEEKNNNGKHKKEKKDNNNDKNENENNNEEIDFAF